MLDLLLKDFADRRAIEELQLVRLRRTLERVYANVPFYRQSFDAAGVTPADLKSLKDLAKFPFTMKHDLRDHYPFGLLAVPRSEIIRIHASSGTTGKPTVVAYTKNDIDTWAETVCRSLQMQGLTENDVIQVGYGYGLFTGGLGAHYGAERLGCSVIPASGGATEKQIMLIRDFGVTCVMCTPSFFMHMMEEADRLGVDFRQTKLRHGIFGAEPWTDEMRKMIEEKSGIKAHDIYGLSELIGPGVAVECEEHKGLHIFEDYFYPEIIDPDTGEVLPDGELGELVLTSLSKFAMPMIRYRTRDLTRIISEPCACGRTLRRIDRISNRSDDMFIIRGVNVFPSQIEAGILRVEGATPNYRITLFTSHGMDNIAVEVELRPELYGDDERVEEFRKKITASVESITGIRVLFKVVEPMAIERSEGKAKRVIDNRTR